MAIVSVKEVGKGEGALSVRDRPEATYTRVWQVETDSRRTGPKAVIEAVPVALGDPYETDTEADPASFARALQARRIADDGCEWEVIADYAPYDVTRFEEHPLSRPVDFSTSQAKFEEVIDQDVNGVAIVNSAGDYFDPPVTRERSRLVLQYERNEASFDLDLAQALADKLNSDTFAGNPPGTVKSEAPIGARVWDPATGFYWRVRYEFQVNEDGWAKVILDQGMRTKVGSTRINAKDAFGQDVASPILLNGSGAALTPGGTAVFRTFTVYESVNYAATFNLE